MMLKLVPLFKNKYKIEKMNLITLTDGGGNYGNSDTMCYDDKSKQIIPSHVENVVIQMFLSIRKNITH